MPIAEHVERLRPIVDEQWKHVASKQNLNRQWFLYNVLDVGPVLETVVDGKPSPDQFRSFIIFNPKNGGESQGAALVALTASDDAEAVKAKLIQGVANMHKFIAATPEMQSAIQ